MGGRGEEDSIELLVCSIDLAGNRNEESSVVVVDRKGPNAFGIDKIEPEAKWTNQRVVNFTWAEIASDEGLSGYKVEIFRTDTNEQIGSTMTLSGVDSKT